MMPNQVCSESGRWERRRVPSVGAESFLSNPIKSSRSRSSKRLTPKGDV